jgi:carboxylesterase type B
LKVLDRPWEPIDTKVEQMMMAYWKDMATTGNPNSASVQAWSPVSPSERSVMRIGADSGPIPPADDVRFDFWKRYFESAQSKNAPIF